MKLSTGAAIAFSTIVVALASGCTSQEDYVTATPPCVVASGQALLPGIVLDGNRGRAYVRAVDGTLAAIDLCDGSTVWTSPAAIEALAVAGDRLAVRRDDPGTRNRFRVGWLDPQTGTPASPDSDAVNLPAWVSVGNAPGRSFYTQAHSAGGRLIVHWSARSWYAGGARPNERILARERRQAGGVLTVDLSNDKIAYREIEAPERSGGVHYWNGWETVTAPWVAGDSRYRFEARAGEQEREIHLVQETAAGGEVIQTTNIDAGRAQAQVSPDGYTVGVFRPPSDAGGGRCRLFEPHEPARTVVLDCANAPLSATILGDSVYLLVTRSSGSTRQRWLQGVGRADGQLRFEYELYTPRRPQQRP